MAIVESLMVLGVEVLQPASPPIAVPGLGDDSGIAQVGLYQPEIDLARQLDAESFIRQYPPQAYIAFDPDQSVVHSLYRETLAPKYMPAVRVPVYIKIEPGKRELKKYGLEVEQEAIGLLSLGWLDKYAPFLHPRTGDRIEYYATPYAGHFQQTTGQPEKLVTREAIQPKVDYTFEVLTVQFVDFWGNSQTPLHVLVTLKNLRAPGRPDYEVKK